MSDAAARAVHVGGGTLGNGQPDPDEAEEAATDHVEKSSVEGAATPNEAVRDNELLPTPYLCKM